MSAETELSVDFAQAFAGTDALFPEAQLKNARIFLTGGTGFFGCLLIESFLWLREQFALGNAQLTILSRDPRGFLTRHPTLARRLDAIEFQQGDVRDFEVPAGHYDYLIHAAGPSRGTPDAEIYALGTQAAMQVLQFAKTAEVRRVLFTSSGSLYGPQPKLLRFMPEDYPLSADATSQGQAKRFTEAKLLEAFREETFEPVFARCYAFMGPYLNLRAHYAAACFALDALSRRPITVQGDGRTVRSYLYGADLAAWLWHLLFRGKAGRSYQVGSAVETAIVDLAKEFSRQTGLPIIIQQASTHAELPERYLPTVERAASE